MFLHTRAGRSEAPTPRIGMDPAMFYTPRPETRALQNVRRGFFSLPLELRNYVYFLVLDPSQEGELGSTKILCLSKQCYEEAIRYLQPCIPVLELGGRHRSLFRDPRANGKPNLYSSTTNSSKCYTYQRFTELEIVKAQSLLISMFQLNYRPVRKEPQILVHLEELLTVLSKTWHMQTLTVCVDWWNRHKSSHLQRILSLIQDLLAICNHKGIKVMLRYPTSTKLAPLAFSVHVHQLRLSSNPILDAFEWWAETLNMSISYKPLENSPYQAMANNYDPFWRSFRVYRTSDILYAPALAGVGINSDLMTLGSSFAISTVSAQVCRDLLYNLPGFYHPSSIQKPYSRTPECRCCLEIFYSEAELRTHLWQFSSHQQPFRKKCWNPVASYLGSGGRTCWTCARQFASLKGLNDHLDQQGHRRYGVVPRYVQDNALFNEIWRAHKEKQGWL